MKILSIVVLLFFFQTALAQKHPLSKSDSGVVNQSLEKYQYLLKKNDLRGASGALNNAAFVYWNNNHYREAAEYYEKSLSINEQVHNENGIAMINNNLGMLYADLENYDKSLASFSKTLAARRSNKEPEGVISALINMAVVLNNLKEYPESVEKLSEALDIARELYDKHQMRSVYGMLSETHEKMGNIDKSMQYFKLYKSFHEEIQREEVKNINKELEEEKLKKQIVEAEKTVKENELLKKELEIFKQDQTIQEADSINQELYADLSKNQVIIQLLEKEKKLSLLEAVATESQNAQLQKEKSNLIIISIIIVLAVFIISILIFVNAKNIKKHARSLEGKNISIERQKIELQKANELKNRVFSIISHDLSSPLNSLRRLFGMMDAFEVDKGLAQALNSIESQLTNSASLLDNLLNWSRSQHKDSHPIIRKVSIRDLVQENIGLLKIQADNKEIELKNEILETDFLETDGTIMTVVIRNLIQNAIKFTPKGGSVIAIFENENNHSFIKIKDTGIGMSENQIAKLFDIDAVRKSVGTEQEKGSGLGLVLCKELIEKVNGFIEVTSEPSVGSSFILKF